MTGRRLDASGLLDWAHAAVGGLVVHAEEMNRLNVFPVADADTGINMLFTMRAALAEAEKRAKKSTDVAQVAAALARGALHGARGNSGVILSQILRGLADVTTSASADITAAVFGAALRHAVGLAVESMGEEIPGTIVSVLHAAAGAAEQCAAAGDELSDTVVATADAAVIALEKTPEQLAVLAECGVVDAGGRGLVVLLDALAATLTGHTPARGEYVPAPPDRSAVSTEPAPVRPPHYEVMYQISGSSQRLDALRDQLEALGDSVAIAGDGGDRYSVHVHADDAGAAIEAAFAVGTPSNIQISTLRGGAASGRWTRRRAVLAVIDGDGAQQLFADEGAHVLRCNVDRVSAKDLLQAVVDTGAGQIMVLPNGYVAAEELVAGCTAATGWGLDVVPVPTGSMVQGLAALAVHEPGRAVVDDGYSMAQAAGATRHGSVRIAAGQALTWAGPCEPGDALGIAGDEVLVVHPEPATTACGLIDLLLAAGGEMVTVLIGAGVDDQMAADLGTHVRQYHPGTELVAYHTGHRGDLLLIGVE